MVAKGHSDPAFTFLQVSGIVERVSQFLYSSDLVLELRHVISDWFDMGQVPIPESVNMSRGLESID